MRRIALFWFALLLLATTARAEFPTTRPYQEVRYLHRVVTGETPQQIHAVWIDLRDRDVSIRVAPGGPDPDGPGGKWQTTLLTPFEISTREEFDVAINGDFFSIEEVLDENGKKRGYVVGAKAIAIGPAATDGKAWASSDKPRPALLIDANKRPVIAEVKDVPAGARQVVAGSDIIVRDAKNIVTSDRPFSTTRHPRTAVGIADGGRTLVMVVVDGRQEGVAAGMSLRELADTMVEFGCESALNLDGGGSSALLLRNPDSGELTLMNRPSGGRQRPVANVLGVTIAGAPRMPATQPGRVGEGG